PIRAPIQCNLSFPFSLHKCQTSVASFTASPTTILCHTVPIQSLSLSSTRWRTSSPWHVRRRPVLICTNLHLSVVIGSFHRDRHALSKDKGSTTTSFLWTTNNEPLAQMGASQGKRWPRV